MIESTALDPIGSYRACIFSRNIFLSGGLMMTMKQPLALSITILLAAALTAQARPRANRGDYRNERPAVGVAYMSVADGEVTKTTGEGDTLAMRAGDEIFAGDLIETTARSRAEIQLDPGNFIRLSANSALRVVQLGNRRFQFELLSGHAALSQWKEARADVEIRAGSLTLIPLKAGTYRVEVEGDRSTAMVRKGEADIGTPSGFRSLNKGRRLIVYSDREKEPVRVAEAPRKDEFDEWTQRRDKVLDRDTGRRYAWFPSYIYGSYGYGYGRHGFGLGVGYGRRYSRYYAPRYSFGFRHVGRRSYRGGHRGSRGRRF